MTLKLEKEEGPGDHKIPQLYYIMSEKLRDYYKGPYLLVLRESSP